ncbi:hypothetical protein PV327_006353 [Microctonus hyperodae]|uniref:Uncharacterized protein n=1 Tax=Microctonus hyperodae TaxID=165561 RepID=A0AA39F479_MICHY|nr:hypothetical protein PV327_006353 [Microctonus hyperodae]
MKRSYYLNNIISTLHNKYNFIIARRTREGDCEEVRKGVLVQCGREYSGSDSEIDNKKSNKSVSSEREENCTKPVTALQHQRLFSDKLFNNIGKRALEQYQKLLQLNKFIKSIMVKTTIQLVDSQTQFGNSRILEPSDCLFVFKATESDYEEPPSDDEIDCQDQSEI